MQNDNQAAIKEMLKGFAYLLEEAMRGTTKNYDGIVVSSSNNKWNVQYNGEIHSVKMYGDGIPQINSMVKVFVPQGNQTLAWSFIPGSAGTGDGATFIPFVSPEGIISWTNDKDLPNPQPVDIKGPEGPQGQQGIQGVQGEKGEKGDKGDIGNQGPKGDTGAQGPQGIQGAPGQAGQDGANATVNGVNTLTIVADGGLTGEQTGDTFTISADGLPFSTQTTKIIPTSGWAYDGTQYYLNLSVVGIKPTDTPLLIPQWTSAIALERQAWNSLLRVQSFTDYIRFYASSPITRSVNFTLYY